MPDFECSLTLEIVRKDRAYRIDYFRSKSTVLRAPSGVAINEILYLLMHIDTSMFNVFSPIVLFNMILREVLSFC